MIEGDLPEVLRIVFALIFVLALMGGLALLLKRLGLSTGTTQNTAKRRLRIIEALPIDHRRRAVILECDDKQHLVILGTNGETLVDSNLKVKKAPKKKAPKKAHGKAKKKK